MESLKSKEAYIAFYKVICILITILSFFTLYYYGKEIWDSREPYIEFFKFNILHEPVTKEYSVDEMMDFLKNTGISILFLIGTLVSLKIIKKIWKALPVPGAFIKYWDDNGEISNILGRYICNHLRGDLRFNNEEWVYLVKYAENQTYYFYKASRSKNYAKIFKKYDPNYKIDYIPNNSETIKAPPAPINKTNTVASKTNSEPHVPKEPTFEESTTTTDKS